MIDLLYYIPIIIALLTSGILLVYGFESRNKKALYIYFGFFTLSVIVFFLHLISQGLDEHTKRIIVKSSYIIFILMPPFFLYALSEIFSKYCYLTKRRMNWFLIFSALVGGMIFFSDDFFTEIANGPGLKISAIYAILFIVYYAAIFAFTVRKFLLEYRDTEEERKGPFLLINAATIVLLGGILLIEVLHQLFGISHFLHEIFVLGVITFIFYNSFRYGLIVIEKNIYIFASVIFSLLIIAGVIYMGGRYEAEMGEAMLSEMMESQRIVLLHAEEHIGEFFKGLEISANTLEETSTMKDYFRYEDKVALRADLEGRLASFERRNGYPAAILNDGGSIIAESRRFRHEQLEKVGSARGSALREDGFAMSEYYSIDGKVRFFLFIQIHSNGIPIGILAIDADADSIKEAFEGKSDRAQIGWIAEGKDIILLHEEIKVADPFIVRALLDNPSDHGIAEDSYGDQVIYSKREVSVAGKEWTIGAAGYVGNIESEHRNIVGKIKNLSFFAVIFVFVSSSAIILIYVRHSRNLKGEVDRKTADLESSKYEIERMNEYLKRSNIELNKKIEELEKTKSAMMNLLEDVQESNKRLESVDEMKTDFMNVASHELKTPLISIIGYTELLLENKALSEEARNSLEIVHRNSARLKQLVSDILMISKLESGSFPMKRKKFDFKELADEAVREVSGGAKQKRIEIKNDSRKAIMNGDEELLSHIFTNLMNNAIKFTPEGGKIILTLGEERGKIVGSVKDTGVGIPKKFINNLFQKFYQVDSGRDRKYGGTGLGLSICKRIVEMHGGRISAESEEGRGSEFIFEIPKKGRREKDGEKDNGGR